MCCTFSWGASKQGAILTAEGYLSRALNEDSFRLKFPKIYEDALKINKSLQSFELNLISIPCAERSFGLTKGEDRELYRKSRALQFRICEKHWLNSNEEVASTIIHELTHLVAEVPDELEASMNEIVIVYYGGGFAGLSYLQEDLNEGNFEELLETEEFKGLKEIGITNKKDFF